MPNIPATSSSRAANEPDRLASANSRRGVIGCGSAGLGHHERGQQHDGDAERASATRSPQPSEAARMNP